MDLHENFAGEISWGTEVTIEFWKLSGSVSMDLLHCALSLAVQCIVIGPVCVCVQRVGGQCLLPR